LFALLLLLQAYATLYYSKQCSAHLLLCLKALLSSPAAAEEPLLYNMH
jgi:hypothetical protein